MYPLFRIYIKTSVRSSILYRISIASFIYVCFSFLFAFFYFCVFSFDFYSNFHFSLVPKKKTDGT